MTEEDISYLISMNYGDIPNSPWYGSAIKNYKKVIEEDNEDTSIDFTFESDEIIVAGKVIFFDDLEDDILELPDDITED